MLLVLPSAGLLLRLYGLLYRLGLGGLPLPPHFHQTQPSSFHSQRDNELQEVIRESKRVGGLLLKAGDQELAAVQQQADKLLHSFK